MVEQEEKRWLRALLEGEVEPGSEEWEQQRMTEKRS